MPAVTRQELSRMIRENALSGVFLFDGIEENLKAEAILEIRKLLLPEGLEELNLSIMENPTADAIIAASETLPFLAEKRLVIVRDFSGLSSRGEADEKLTDYMDHVPDSVVLIFLVTGKADSRKKLYKKINAGGKTVSFSQLSEAELNGWIQNIFREHEKLCAPATASLLAFTVGSDTALLRQEIGKLCAYVGERSGVTDEDVREMATPSVECRVFDLTDAVSNGEQARAFSLLRELERNGEQRTGLLAMILRQYRILQQIKIMQYEKQSPGEMCRLLGIKDFALKRYLQQARKLSGPEVRDGVRICMDFEYRIKSGGISETGAPEACLLKLFSLKNPASN